MFEQKVKTALIKVLTEFGEEEVERIKRAIKDKDAIASGKLYNSIAFTIKENNLEVKLEILAEDYIKWIDEGRRPGKFPPINKIKTWIQKKGIRPRGNISQKSLAYLIGRKIAKKGIKPKRILNLRQRDLDMRIEETIKIIIESDFQPNIE